MVVRPRLDDSDHRPAAAQVGFKDPSIRSLNGKSAIIPVRVASAGWTMPNSPNWQTHSVAVISPDSRAKRN